MALQTEFSFTLPKGYVDSDGTLHRRGTMRLATARDEIEPLRDARVSGPDDPFLTVIVLARVVSELGSISGVSTREIEGLFAADLAYLQDVYGIINFGSDADIAAFVEAERAASSTRAPVDTPPPADDGGSPSHDDATPAMARPRRAAIEEVPSTER
jgi:hypothetical protein